MAAKKRIARWGSTLTEGHELVFMVRRTGNRADLRIGPLEIPTQDIDGFAKATIKKIGRKLGYTMWHDYLVGARLEAVMQKELELQLAARAPSPPFEPAVLAKIKRKLNR